jgi:hypothetical protein
MRAFCAAVRAKPLLFVVALSCVAVESFFPAQAAIEMAIVTATSLSRIVFSCVE